VWETVEVLFRVSVERRDGKRPLGRPMHKWKENIKIILK